MKRQRWQRTIRQSNAPHRSFGEILNCVVIEAKKMYELYDRIPEVAYCVFFMSLHALYLYQNDHIGYADYRSMMRDLNLLSPRTTCFYDKTHYAKWPDLFPSIDIDFKDRGICSFQKKCNCMM